MSRHGSSRLAMNSRADHGAGWPPPYGYPPLDAACDRGGRLHGSSFAWPVAIRIVQGFDAPPGRVFDAWLDPAIAAQWLFATATQRLKHVEIEPRVHGAFRLVEGRARATLEHRGEYVSIVRDRRLVFTLRMGSRASVDTRVSVDIDAQARGCRLSLLHENVAPECASEMERRWTGSFYGLGVTLDRSTDAYNHERNEP